MKKWQKIYEAFKKSDLLDAHDKEFICITDKLISLKQADKMVYSKEWMESWMRTTKLVNIIKNYYVSICTQQASDQ